MRKLLVCIIMFIVVLNSAGNKKSFSLLDYFSGEYTVYTSTDNSQNSVDLGFCYMNSSPVAKNVIGESMEIKNFEVASALKTLKAKVVKTETLEDGTVVIYAYTSLIKDKVKVAGEVVNLQLANREDITVIGWPLILGSF